MVENNWSWGTPCPENFKELPLAVEDCMEYTSAFWMGSLVSAQKPFLHAVVKRSIQATDLCHVVSELLTLPVYCSLVRLSVLGFA